MDKEALDKMRGNPENWKWGLIYYNPEDPRTVLPKKIKWLGFTLNFAKPLAYLILVLSVVGIILLKNYLHA